MYSKFHRGEWHGAFLILKGDSEVSRELMKIETKLGFAYNAWKKFQTYSLKMVVKNGDLQSVKKITNLNKSKKLRCADGNLGIHRSFHCSLWSVQATASCFAHFS